MNKPLLTLTRRRAMQSGLGAVSIAAMAVGAGRPVAVKPAIAQVQLPSSGDLDRTRPPLPEPPFEGKIGETYLDSKGSWPKVPAPPAGAPNIVVILLDDVG